MVPRTIRRLLSRLRARERALAQGRRAAWAVAGCAALLVVACLVDYLVDLWQETPRPVRVGLLGMQVVGWLVALGMVLQPLFRRRSDEALALHLEEKLPALGHRLISAVQLNRDGAKVEGMSPDLIAAVTRQAEQQAAEVRVEKVYPSRPLHAAGAVTVGTLAFFTLVTLLEP